MIGKSHKIVKEYRLRMAAGSILFVSWYFNHRAMSRNWLCSNVQNHIFFTELAQVFTRQVLSIKFDLILIPRCLELK